RTPNPTDVVQSLGNDSVVYFSGAAGPIEVSETLRLRNGQRVVGGPGWVTVFGEETGTTAGFEVKGDRPLVRGTNPDRDVFQLGYSNSRNKGLDIEGGRNGIAGKGADQYAILENQITGAARSSDPELADA